MYMVGHANWLQGVHVPARDNTSLHKQDRSTESYSATLQDQVHGHEQGNPQAHPPQHHANFEHLVEHAAAQHSQAGYGDKGGHLEAGMQGQGGLMRPQAHKPPQATKSSRFRGVYKRQRGGRWEASIVLDSKNCRFVTRILLLI